MPSTYRRKLFSFGGTCYDSLFIAEFQHDILATQFALMVDCWFMWVFVFFTTIIFVDFRFVSFSSLLSCFIFSYWIQTTKSCCMKITNKKNDLGMTLGGKYKVCHELTSRIIFKNCCKCDQWVGFGTAAKWLWKMHAEVKSQ